jgi:hypothetical protein
MATQYSNKPIVTDGLVYALDFGNPKSYVSGSTTANSLLYNPTTASVSASGLDNQGFLNLGTNNYVVTNQLYNLGYTSGYTIMYTVDPKGGQSNRESTQITQAGNANTQRFWSGISSTRVSHWFLPTTSVNSTTAYTGRRFNITPGKQHIAIRYSSGSYDLFRNGVPVSPSAGPNLGDAAAGGTLSIGLPSGYFGVTGSFAQFQVYDRALTSDEIWNNYQLSAQRYGIGTVSTKPYTLDENAYLFLQSAGITDPIITGSIDTFVRGLKANNLWDKMIAIYPFVGTGSDGVNLTGSQSWNLKEPTTAFYKLTYNGSWEGSTSGSAPSGSGTYINSGINPKSYHPYFLNNNAHISILSYDTPVSSSYLMGTGMTEDLAISTLAGDYGTPAAAYSVRKVRTAYSGALMDVRRSIDNVTQSIGYVDSGDLDTGSLLNFVKTEGDDYLPGAYGGLAAAYSLRKVSASYDGYAIDVRRIWDNTTSSIGFDVNGNLDTGLLLNFTTSGSNILPYSNDFTQADWTKYDVQITASAVLGPYRLGSGSFVNETSTNSSHVFNENINPVNISSIHTISCFVKKQERRYVGLAFAYNSANHSYVTFDLDTTSSVSSGSAGTGYLVASSSINYVTDGWFRISLIGTVGLNDFYPRFYLTKDTTGYQPIYVGEPGTGSYIYGFQYTTGSTVQPYIETTGTARYNVGNTSSFGYVTQWYDQSGNNRHATQTATGSQPLIVSSGSLVTENGKPAVRFDGSTNYLETSTFGPISQPYTTFTHVEYASMPEYPYLVDHGSETGIVGAYNAGGGHRIYAGGNLYFGSSAVINTPYLYYGLFSGSNSAISINGATAVSGSPGGSGISKITLGAAGTQAPSTFFSGSFFEHLEYHSDQSANKALIENNINNYYNIYTGSNHGFVARWYDQSGNNRHATQTATGSQPVIVESGSIITENSRSALSFDGTSMFFNLSSNITATSPFSSFAVGRRSTNGTAMLFYGGSGVTHGLSVDDRYYLQKSSGYLQSNNTDTTNQQILLSGIATTTTQSQFKNSSEIASTFTAAGIATTVSKLGYYVDASPYYFNGKYQELSLYLTDQTPNRQAVEYGINNYYNIYPQTSSFATSSFAIYTTSGSVSASLNNRLTSGIPSSGPLGLITVSRTGSNSLTIARNGAVSSFTTPASGALSTGIYLGAINNNGLALGNSPLNLSFASVGTGLTGAETSTYFTLVGNLQNSLNRPDLTATDFIAAVGTLTLTQQNAIDTLVKDLKRFSLWDKMKAIYPFVGGTAEAHKYNLKDPRDLDVAYRLTFSGTWTHNSSGSQPTNSRADSYIVPPTDLERDSVHLSIYSQTSAVTSGADWAAQFNTFYFGPLLAGNLYATINNGELNTGNTPYSSARGLLIATRVNSNTINFYYNTNLLRTSTVNSAAGSSTQTLLLGGFSDGRYNSNKMWSFGTVGSGLSTIDITNLYTAVQRFQTTLGRQV